MTARQQTEELEASSRSAADGTPDSEFWIQRELGRAAASVSHIRIAASLLLASLAIVFWVAEPSTWRSWLLLVASLVVGGFGLYELLHPQEPRFTIARAAYYLGTIVTFQAVIIVSTGGIESPVIFIFVPWAVIAAFSFGEVRAFAFAVCVPVCFVLALAIGHDQNLLPNLMPEIFGGPAAVVRDELYLWTYTAVIALIMLLTGAIALRLRQGLNQAVVAAAVARHEAIATMHDRNRGLVHLSGALAHELKNPLASIQGLAGLLARKAEPGTKQAEQLDVLLGEVRRMGTVLDEFLNFSRPVDSLAVRDVNADRLLAEVASLHEGVAADRGVSLQTDLAASEPLRADPRKLKQVLVNLVQNALEATPRGGAVRLAARTEPGRCTVFEVTDTGAGLDEEIRSRLFRPGATTKAEGSGLGLVIARSIAEQHGGTLELVDRDGGGCKAVFRVPTHVSTEEESAQAAAETAEGGDR